MKSPNPLPSPAVDRLARYRPKVDPLRRECPLRVAVDVIRGRWKPSIFYHLSRGPKRFTELADALTGITAQTLTLQLRQLEADGVVRRSVHGGVPPRVEYALTDSGRRLWRIVLKLEQWAAQHLT